VFKKEEFIQLVVNSPRYKKLLIQSEMAQNKINEARFEARPDILLGVNYRQENVAPVNHFYHGMVSVVIPIIDHGQHSVEAARAEKRRTDAIRSFENDQILSLIHQAFSEYEGSKKALEVFRLKNLSSLEKKFLEAEKSFRKGFIDALTFLQIDSQVHENIDQIYLSRVSYVNAVSQLHLLIGKGPQ
jgi:outer membrane protein TolC